MAYFCPGSSTQAHNLQNNMQIISFSPMHSCSRILMGLWCCLFVMLSAGLDARGAAPTAEDDAKIVGTWHVKGPGFDRRYEITAGRNIRIEGDGYQAKRGRLSPQKDGGYLVKLESLVLRIALLPANDQLQVECFTEKNLQLGLGSMWKVTAPRVSPPQGKP
jgi:hypothetical protein